MDKLVIYQTLEDRDNPDFIEDNGPFPCTRKNAWLGEGYYFWEHFIENAHWWGKINENYSNGYVICKSTCDKGSESCFDLYDNYNHIDTFNDAIKILKAQRLYTSNITTVARIIEYLRTTLKIFKYEATRAYGVNSKSSSSEYSQRVIFDIYHPKKYLDSYPAIQVCLYKKTGLNRKDFKIVYPDVYVEGYVV